MKKPPEKLSIGELFTTLTELENKPSLSQASKRQEKKKDLIHWLTVIGFIISFILAAIIVISAIMHLFFPLLFEGAAWEDINKLALIIVSITGGLVKDRVKDLFE